MDTRKLQKIEKVSFYILLGITVSWFFLYINKGIDVTDSAYYFTKYKYGFVENMEVVNTGTFLTDLLGTGIYHLSGTGQVFLLSFSSWLLYMGSGLLVFQCLKKYVPRVLLILSVLGGSLFSLTWVHAMNYNATSMFMQTVAICILIKGIEQEKIRYYVLSGIVYGLNVFFRVPNILHICTGISIVWYFFCCKKEWKKCVYSAGAFGLGVAGGGIAAGGLAFSLLGKEKVISYFFKTASTAGDAQSNHGIRPMLQKIAMNTRQGIQDWLHYGILLLAILVVWNLLIRNKERLSVKEWSLYAGLCAVLVLYGIYVGWKLESVQLPWMLGPCIVCIMLAGAFYYRKTNALLSTICVITFCAETVLCIGTDNGWYYQVVFLIFPLCACIGGVYNCRDIGLRRNLILCTAFVAAILFTVGGLYSFQFVYRDAPNGELKYPIQAEEYKGIYTSKERAEYLNELDGVLKELEGQELLSFGEFNIGHVIADMPPFLGRVWVDLESYPVATFEMELESAIEKKGYPIVLIADLNQNGQYMSMEKLDVVRRMLREGNYIKYYENEWYCIYRPGK